MKKGFRGSQTFQRLIRCKDASLSIFLLFVCLFSLSVPPFPLRYYKLASWMGESQALVDAAGNGELSVCRSLLENGADPNSCQRMTPLANAVKGGHVEVVKLLLMHGADPANKSKEKLPVEYAREGGFLDCVTLLELNGGICGGCQKQMTAAEAKRCGKCKLVKFCSVDCQKKCWSKFHKKQCAIWTERKDQLKNRK